MHCKCRVTEKLIRLLLKNALGEDSVLKELNAFLKSLRLSYQLEITQTKKYPGVCDDPIRDATIETKNTIRGDQVRKVLMNYQKLIDICIPAGDEAQNAKREKIIALWKSWKVLEPIFTDVTNPANNRPWADYTKEEIMGAKERIKIFVESLKVAYPTVTEEDNDICTAYLHFIGCHLSEVLDTHPNFARLQNQGDLILSLLNLI